MTQRQRLRRRWLLHGVSLLLLLPCALLLAAFLLDHFLRLPAPIRVFHALLVLAGLLGAAWRFVVYPQRKRLDAQDIAILLERSYPELHERLVSAVQLKDSLVEGKDLRNQSAAMIGQLLEDAASKAGALPLDQLFDGRRTARLWAGALLLVSLSLGGALQAPLVAKAFLLRHLGLSVSYPRATDLIVELPEAGPDLSRRDEDGMSELVVPAGADLHVSVLAQGVVPDEVFLDVQQQASGGADAPVRSLQTQPRPGGRFRHVFRRITQEFTFRARGGDDDAGDRLVVVRIVRPPLVAEIFAEVTPPAYTQRPVEIQSGGAIEALIGARIQLRVAATQSARSAELAFLESGLRLPLEFEQTADDAGSKEAWTGTFAVQQNDRYQVELVGSDGLASPNPGIYPVTALLDHAPVGRWLLPDDESNTLLLPDGVLCVRATVRDDFGLAAGELSVDLGQDQAVRRAVLPPTKDQAAPTSALLLELIEVRELLGAQRQADGLSLQLLFRDNREPEPNATELPRRQVQIVDLAQLSAAIARQFRALREEAEQALDLQNDRRARLIDLLAEDALSTAKATQELTAVEVGQGRILSAAERLVRGTMRAFDVHLWNRLDPSPNAAAVLELYRDWHRDNGDAQSFQPAFYRELAQRRATGQIGGLEQALDPILRMVQLADRLHEELGPQILRGLAQAQVAASTAAEREALQAVGSLQEQAAAALAELLAQLDEWNDYQDLVQEARSLREKQRDIQSRTEEIRGRK